MGAMVSRAERLEEFFRRLSEANPASSYEEAVTLIRETLNAVEDELSGVPFDPTAWRTDGRMYPPEDDNAIDVDGHEDIVKLRSRGHDTYVRANGAIEVWHRGTESVLVSKAGTDGQSVWEDAAQSGHDRGEHETDTD